MDTHAAKVLENKDQKYSLRVFAKDLGISSGRLNDFLKGTNLPSQRTLQRMVTRLKLSTETLRDLQIAVESEKKRRLLHKAEIILKSENYSIIVDWEPYAIMCLLLTRNFKLTPEAVAQRLGITLERAEESITKLVELKMITYVDQQWQPSNRKVATETDIPSDLIRKSHNVKLDLAAKRLEDVNVLARDFSAITFPVDLEKMNTAKRMLMEFRRSLAEALSCGNVTEVYSLNIQLFPLTKFSADQTVLNTKAL